MSKKTILILITVVIVAGAIIFGVYYFTNKNKTAKINVVDDIYNAFDPFGTGGEGITGNGVNPIEENVKQTPNFYRLTDFAVAGATFYQDKKVLAEAEKVEPVIDPKTKKIITPSISFNTVPSLKVVERATGHIYNIDVKTKIKNKISNSTIPGIHEALFSKEASSVIYRYLSSDMETVSSFLVSFSGVKGEFLPSNILEIVTSPDKSKFFYLIKSNTGVIGYSRSYSDKKNTQIFTSPFTEWLPQWINDQKIFLTTKASYLSDGNLFSLDIKTGALSKVLGGVKGLTTLSNNDGTRVLYGASLSSGPKLNIFNIKEHSTKEISSFGLPEKCVWSKSGLYIYCATPNKIKGLQYPDIWYQGLESFNDSFIKIDVLTGSVSNILNSESITAVDATNLFLSDNEEQLFFINKKDSTLWGLNLY